MIAEIAAHIVSVLPVPSSKTGVFFGRQQKNWVDMLLRQDPHTLAELYSAGFAHRNPAKILQPWCYPLQTEDNTLEKAWPTPGHFHTDSNLLPEHFRKADRNDGSVWFWKNFF